MGTDNPTAPSPDDLGLKARPRPGQLAVHAGWVFQWRMGPHGQGFIALCELEEPGDHVGTVSAEIAPGLSVRGRLRWVYAALLASLGVYSREEADEAATYFLEVATEAGWRPPTPAAAEPPALVRLLAITAPGAALGELTANPRALVDEMRRAHARNDLAVLSSAERTWVVPPDAVVLAVEHAKIEEQKEDSHG